MTRQKFAQSNAAGEDTTIAWSANLSPPFKINKSFEMGQNSVKSIQKEFTGSDGFVVIEPNEEVSVTQS